MRVLIEFKKKPLLFENPEDVISCNRLRDVSACFDRMEEALARGKYLAGFVSYEAGYSFELCLDEKREFDFPLVQMGVYRKPEVRSKRLEGKKLEGEKGIQGYLKIAGINISKDEYFSNINKIRSHIAAGDVYQITYCIKFNFDFTGDPYTLYRQLYKDQPVPYPAYIETDDFKVLSLSPEMFIKKRGSFVATKPMKGTWPRGRNFFEDMFAGRKLHYDKKNRAENIMICDLLRNDLGRVGHSIRAPKLYEVAKYNTLFQMTSTVTGDVDKNIKALDLFKALHPSGSVTGAPKIRAMEIIKDIEKEDRRIYTGAIGYITPQKDMFFNVPIRTLLIRDGKGEMGVGGGIVWDSTPEGEWEEGMIKAKFLTERL